jgi:sec-independent protein translocase protein TatB
MGGLGPGIGGMEYIVIAIVALLVLGPERLPGMLNKLGKWVAKARGMANDFRASFDEMARQSELDELRKEVEALRQGQMVPLGAEADTAFKDIRDEMNKPLDSPRPAPVAAEDWSDSPPITPQTVETPPKVRKPRASSAKTQTPSTAAAKAADPATKAKTPGKPRAPRKTAAKS